MGASTKGAKSPCNRLVLLAIVVGILLWKVCLMGCLFCVGHNFVTNFMTAFICDELKVGLGFEKDENGLVSSGEIKMKVDQLLSDENLRSRSLELKEKLIKNIAQGGRSSENFSRFVMWLKE